MLTGILLTASAMSINAGVRITPQEHLAPMAEANPLLKNLKTAPTKGFIGEQKLGTRIFGATVVDYNNLPSYFQFYTSNPSGTSTKLSPLEESAANAPKVSFTGTWAGDAYYAEIVKVYSTTYRLVGWMKVDPTTGDHEYFVDNCMDSSNNYGRFTWEPDYYGNYDGKYYFVYDMMWDPTTDTIYGFAYPADYNSKNIHFATQFGEIDKNTGEFEPIHCFDDDVYFQTGAFDYDGNLYAMRYDIKTNTSTTTDAEGNTVTTTTDVFNGSYLCKIDLDTYQDTKIGDVITKNGAKYLPYSQLTMDFDHTTGDLYMACLPLADGATSASGPSEVFRLNIDNGEAEYLGSIYAAETMTGMHVPYTTADSRTAPAQVADLTAVSGVNGPTLSWTNPTKAWNRTDLSGLVKVAVARDTQDNIVATLDPTGMGEAQTFTDTDAPQGLHDYYVMAQCKEGENGVPSKITVWAGYDYAAAPSNITIEKITDNSVKLTWEAPTVGANEGVIDTDNMTYTVTRYPDNVVVAEGITALELTDATDAIDSYYYGIKAVTPIGDGVEGHSPRCLFGLMLNPPYECLMEDVDAAASWRVFDGATSYEYNVESCYAAWDTGIACPWQGIRFDVSSRRNDFYIVTPDIAVKEGKQYRLTMKVYYHYMPTIYTPTIHHDFSLVAGEGIDQSTYTAIYSEEDYRPTEYYTTRTLSAYYTSDHTGKCNFGYHEYTANVSDDVDFISVQYCLVEELADDDLAAAEITGPSAAPVGEPTNYTVAVRNEGRATVSDYTVQVVRSYEDLEILLGETVVKGQPIGNLETAYITVAATPDVEGTCELRGKVIYANDQNPDNNLTPAITVDALPEGSVAFNHTIDGDDHGYDTSIPMSWYKSASICQSIYPEDMHGIALNSGEDKVTIHGVGYVYTPNSGQTADIENVALKVYLGQTDKTVVASGDSYIDLNAQQLMFDGTVNVPYGAAGSILNIPFAVEDMFAFNDPAKSLVVTVIRTDSGATGDTWPILWHNFNTNWSSDSYLTLYTNTITDAVGSSIAGYSTTVSPCVPIMRLAVKHSVSGVEKVADFIPALAYNNLSRELYVGEYADAEVAIHTLDGKLVMKTRANGSDPIRVNLANGIYVARVTAANGSATLKFAVK